MEPNEEGRGNVGCPLSRGQKRREQQPGNSRDRSQSVFCLQRIFAYGQARSSYADGRRQSESTGLEVFLLRNQ